MKKMAIALDGPAGAGKSTIAKLISDNLGIPYLDTGAMYRAITLKLKREGTDLSNSEEVDRIVLGADVGVEFSKDGQITLLDGVNCEPDIRDPGVSDMVSDVAALGVVRTKLVDLQREIAAGQSIVVDGRDIGTNVLPDAELKIFLTASVEERANRRYKELVEKNVEGVTYDSIKSNIEQRDHIDSTREISPLKKADDAIELDTTELNISQVVEAIRKLISEKNLV